MSNGNDDGTWRDEMMIQALHAVVHDAVSAAARAEIDLPHIVICRDPETSVVSYTGPFRDGMAALAFAERESERDRAFSPDGPMEFTVAALCPIEPSTVETGL